MSDGAVSVVRRAALALALGVAFGCQPTGLAPIGGGGGGGAPTVTPAPDTTTGGTLTPSTAPATPGFPVVLPPVDTSAPPLQPTTASPSPGPSASPGSTFSPAPFPAVSPPPSPGPAAGA